VSLIGTARSWAGRLKISRYMRIPVKYSVVSSQQRRPYLPALPVWPDGEDRQVMMRSTEWVMLIKNVIERLEASQPGTGRSGQPRLVITRRTRQRRADANPQRRRVALGRGVDNPGRKRVLNVKPEVAGQDLPAGIGVRDQPLRLRQVIERIGDDLTEHLDIGFARGDHPSGRLRGI
jgi:hypothetical protein